MSDLGECDAKDAFTKEETSENTLRCMMKSDQGSLIVQSLKEATALDPTLRLETLNT